MSRVIKVTEQKMSPQAIEVRGARVHNLKDIDIDIPLGKLVGIAGVSGSGKSSLALGVLYAEGSRRYLEALSTYTRRRLTQAEHAQVDEVLHVPAALALHQRPSVPGVRSTFGTMTELNNSLRLLFSRCAHHVCPHCGARVEPSLNVAAGLSLTCPTCGREFYAPSAEDLAFNSGGACPTCGGTGVMHEVDEASLVPDESKTINEGAVLPWGTLMWDLMKQVAGEMGVRTDVPFRELTEKEKDIVFHGPAIKKHMIYQNKTSGAAGEMDFTYFNAVYTVENALSKVKDENGMKRVEKFLKTEPCPDCGGSRLSEKARAPKLRGISLDEVCRMTLAGLTDWVADVPGSLPEEMRPMAQSICDSFTLNAKRLLELGLGYLTLDRAASTLSTGERQRMQLARAVRNRTTGVLYVLDEPSIGLHPANIVGLTGVMHDLIDDGNSVLLVDHDTQILSEADWLIEMGPEAGAKGGHVIAEGTTDDIKINENSQIGPFLAGKQGISRQKAAESELFQNGAIHLSTDRIHTVKPLEVDIPKGRLTVVTGVSGSGKTTLLNILAALDRPTEGEVFLNGRALSTIGEKEIASFRRQNLGFVFQDFNLLDTFTLQDNIFLPLVLAGKHFPEMQAKLLPLAQQLGIADLLQKYPYEVSGGQKQRAAVARALITSPQILLADEPTGALDSRASDSLLSLFGEINRAGQTILMVTHSTKAASHAGRVLFIKDGVVFHQIYRGGSTNEEMFHRISDTLTAMAAGA